LSKNLASYAKELEARLAKYESGNLKAEFNFQLSIIHLFQSIRVFSAAG